MPHLDPPLRLTGPMIARIFLGQITKWDDPVMLSRPATVQSLLSGRPGTISVVARSRVGSWPAFAARPHRGTGWRR